jgi:hypothetical protein
MRRGMAPPTHFLFCEQKVWFREVGLQKWLLKHPAIKMKNEVGGACDTQGRGEKRVQGFGGKARGKEVILKTTA